MSLFNKPSLYIVIRESSIQAVKGSLSGRAAKVEAFASLSLPQPLNEIYDETEVRKIGLILDDFLKREHLLASTATVVLNREGIVARTARVPGVGTNKLESFMKTEISEFLPVDLSDYNYGYRVMHTSTDNNDGPETLELILAAVPNRMLDQTMKILEMTNLKINAIDISVNSLLHILNNSVLEGLAILDADPNGARISIYNGNVLLLYVDIPVRMTTDEQDLSQLIQETRGYLNFFSSRHQGKTVSALYITGMLENLDTKTLQSMSLTLGIPVKTDFEELLPFACTDNTGLDFSVQLPKYAACLGAMLRRDTR
ncbi:MAG: type IV pilus biogenesis protein PilM [Acidobacteriota bacterium]